MRRIAPVVKISGAILHILDRPLRHFYRQWEAFGIAVMKENESVDRLRRTLNVDWQEFCGRNIAEFHPRGKMFFSSTRIRSACVFKLMIAGGFAIILEAIQNVRGVKIVHPVQICRFAVIPR